MIFQKSALAGSCITSTGKLLEFTNDFYETEDPLEIEFLKSFPCYSIVDTKPEAKQQEKAPARTGSLSSATVLK